MFRKVFICIILIIVICGPFSFAEGPISVAISQVPPNVIKTENGYTGFDIELWEEVAKELNIPFEYKETPFKKILKGLEDKDIDVGVAAITINVDRERKIDFSHHYLDSGLRIMIPKEESGVTSYVKSVFTPTTIKCLIYLTIFIMICGHILWIAEKGENAINDRYFPGIFDAIWCSIATMTTVGYGDIAPRRWLGRTAAFLIMIVGIGFFGIIISQLTSTMTTNKFISSIQSKEDLCGKIVATKAGTTSQSVLEEIGAEVKAFPNICDAYDALLEGNVQSVLFDSPSILYFSENEGKGKVTVVRRLFDIQYYGFALQPESELREDINRCILKLRSDGTYDKLYKKWFNKGG